MNIRRRTTCRVCGSDSLKPVIDLGEQYLQGSFVKAGMPAPPRRKIQCSLVRCCPESDENACGLLQMQHSVPPEILYSTYWYRSGTNQTMRDHLRGIVEKAEEMTCPLLCRVLDIGCNDGTLLSFYTKANKQRMVGIDPSDCERVEGVDAEFIKSLYPCSKIEGDVFTIITSIAMFYDLESPVCFARNIADNLQANGIWILEMSYMPRMLELNSYDTICHEHLEYYSLASIEKICAKAGLKVVRVELNESNGGSIRCYVAHEETAVFDNPEWQQEIQAIRTAEFDKQLDTDKPYRSFQERIERHREELMKLLTDLRKSGKRIHIYGASTKGNTILQWCGIDSRLIECAADRNPDKDGAFTLGTDIPIVSEEKSRAMKPDYYLVLPWHFSDEFLKREQALLDAGVGFIFPLPELKVIKQ